MILTLTNSFQFILIYFISSHSIFSAFDSNPLLEVCGVFLHFTVQKTKPFVKDSFSKCDQIRRKLRNWSRSLNQSLAEAFVKVCHEGYKPKNLIYLSHFFTAGSEELS